MTGLLFATIFFVLNRAKNSSENPAAK